MGKKNKSKNKQQSPKPTTNSSDTKEPEQSSLIGNLIDTVTQAVTSVSTTVLGSSSTEKGAPEVQRSEDNVSSSREKVEENPQENDMGKRSVEEEKDHLKEAGAISPKEKRQKYELDGVDSDVATVIKELSELGDKQKKKYKARIRTENPDLYARFIEVRQNKTKGSESPQKTPEENKQSDEAVKETPKKAPVKLNRSTPLPEMREEKDAEKDVPVDETFEQDVSASEAKKREVAVSGNQLETNGELRKSHEKISFTITKKANTSDWSESNNGESEWKVEGNKKKKDTKENVKDPKEERQQAKSAESQAGSRFEDNQGAKMKEGSSKKKNKKKQSKKQEFPVGHPQHVPTPEQHEHEPRQYSAQGSRNRSRSNSARRKPWDLQKITRRDGSVILQEVNGDLFHASDAHSLVHCVSADFHMGKGIAVQFKNRFGGVGELLRFGARTGEMAFLSRNNRFIYYLVTKEQYHKKPTMRTLESSLEHMRNHCIQNRVKFIAMPTIGCGLDRLDWYNVRDLLVHMFRETPVEITVFKG